MNEAGCSDPPYHTHTLSLSHTHTLSLSLSHSHTLTHSLSLSLTHTHPPTGARRGPHVPPAVSPWPAAWRLPLDCHLHHTSRPQAHEQHRNRDQVRMSGSAGGQGCCFYGCDLTQSLLPLLIFRRQVDRSYYVQFVPRKTIGCERALEVRI